MQILHVHTSLHAKEILNHLSCMKISQLPYVGLLGKEFLFNR